MPYVDRALIDPVTTSRSSGFNVVPTLPLWQNAFRCLPRAPKVTGMMGGIVALGYTWQFSYFGLWCRWICNDLSFTLPPKPAGCSGMAWLTTSSAVWWSFAQHGRPLFDLDCWANPTGKAALRVTPSPLWKTWNYKKRVVVNPTHVARVPEVLPTHAAGAAYYTLLGLSVRYYY